MTRHPVFLLVLGITILFTAVFLGHFVQAQVERQPTVDVWQAFVLASSRVVSLLAADRIPLENPVMLVKGSGAARTLTSTPTIPDGLDGQLLILIGMDNTNTLTIQDQGTLAGSNLELGASTRVLGQGDVLVLVYHNSGNSRYVPPITTSNWYEITFTNN